MYSVTEAEGVLRDLHSWSLGPQLVLLPREVVGLIAEAEKGRRMVSRAVCMDRDAVLTRLRISRPSRYRAWIPYVQLVPEGPFVLDDKVPSNFNFWSQSPSFCDHTYHNDDTTYYKYILKLPSLRHLTLYNAPTPALCIRAAAARACTNLQHLYVTFNVRVRDNKGDSLLVTAEEAKEMASALVQLTSLKTLHLGGLDPHSSGELIPVVMDHLTGLRALRLVWSSDNAMPFDPSLIRQAKAQGMSACLHVVQPACMCAAAD